MSVADHELIPELDRRGLRKFAITLGCIFMVLFGIVFPWVLSANTPIWPWALGAGLIGWGVLAPDSVRGLYRAWMRLALLLNKITTPVLLSVLYFVLFTPIALIMRAVGRDTMQRGADAQQPSYRSKSTPRSRDHMDRPF